MKNKEEVPEGYKRCRKHDWIWKEGTYFIG